jgi:tRNA1(Val) A37 N6-methylase TrmN6
LRYGGKFVCVWRPDRLTELLAAMRQASLEPKRMTFVHADADTPPSAVLTEAIKGAAPALRVTAPLLLYQKPAGVQSRRNLTDAAQKIYDTCLFPD